MAVPVVLTFTAGLLYMLPATRRVVANKAVFVVVLSVIIFSLQPLIYPQLIGKELPVDAVTTSGPMASAFLEITLIGSVLLALMVGLYTRIAMRGPSGPDL